MKKQAPRKERLISQPPQQVEGWSRSWLWLPALLFLAACLITAGFLLRFNGQAETGYGQFAAPQYLATSLPPQPTLTASPQPPKLLFLPVLSKANSTASMALVPAGSFQMGCNSDNDGCTSKQRPLHLVLLDDFWIDRTEVTNAEYAACVAAGACRPPASNSSVTRQFYFENPEYATYPVVSVTWSQAAIYCTWAGKRLPTEAEWEKAARGSQDSRPYPWGDASLSCAYLNYRSQAGFCLGDTAPVDSYPQGVSPYGVMEMAGNVWEWVADWYAEDYYTSYSPEAWPANPTGPESGEYRVIRGGSWDLDQRSVRLSRRQWGLPEDLDTSTGFRCAK